MRLSILAALALLLLAAAAAAITTTDLVGVSFGSVPGEAGGSCAFPATMPCAMG